MNADKFIKEKKEKLDGLSQKIKNLEKNLAEEKLGEGRDNKIKILRDKKGQVEDLLKRAEDRNEDLIQALSLRIEDSIDYLEKSIDRVKNQL
ncbi:MAG: hypothetical protein ACLFSQ_03825 [Candidatus Zixiibacteriota bacterium]